MERNSFYDAETVKHDMTRELESEHRNGNITLDAWESLERQANRAKRGLNLALFGDENKRFIIHSMTPTASRIADNFPMSIERIKHLWEKDVSLDVIKDNALPDGAKFSRAFTRKYSKQDVSLSTYSLKKELPGLPDESTTPAIFIQNFYSTLAAFKANIVITTAFVDMLTPSNYAAFSSCNSWTGCYSVSGLSRALDDCSAMAFLVNSNSIKKQGRVWLTFDMQDNCRRFCHFITYGELSKPNIGKIIEKTKDALAVNLGYDKDAWRCEDNTGRSRDGEGDIFDDDFYRAAAYIDRPQYVYSLDCDFTFQPDWEKAHCIECGEEHRGDYLLCRDCQEGNTYTCAACGERISEDESYYDEHTDETLCESCYHDRYVRCAGCGEMLYRDGDGVYADPTGGNDYYCETCYYDTFSHCDYCENDVRADELQEINGQYVCDDCLRSYFTQCDTCGEYVENDNAYTYSTGDTLCKACAEEAYEDENDNFFKAQVYADMFQESVFSQLQNETFSLARVYVPYPELEQYVIMKDNDTRRFIADTFKTAIRDRMPMRVVRVYKTDTCYDLDFACLAHDGRMEIFNAENIEAILTKEQGEAMLHERQVYLTTFGNDCFNRLQKTSFPIYCEHASIGDVVTFRNYDDISNMPENVVYITDTMVVIMDNKLPSVIYVHEMRAGIECVRCTTEVNGRRYDFIYQVNWIEGVVARGQSLAA